mgnify:CR=1 FL=1
MLVDWVSDEFCGDGGKKVSTDTYQREHATKWLAELPNLSGVENPWPVYERLKRELDGICGWRSERPDRVLYTDTFREMLERIGL